MTLETKNEHALMSHKHKWRRIGILPDVRLGINRVLTVDILTLMVLSPEADTMYLSSKSTTLTAARWPTRTRRRVMSVAEAMSHTAMERSLEQVTISPLLKRKWSTASLWWINVFKTSPVFTSQTLKQNRRAQCLITETTRKRLESVLWAHY